MTETTDPTSINFFDPATNDCPYHAYQTLRDEAPVWQDPHTGMFVVTRYEDIKSILANPDLFTNAVGSAAGMTEKACEELVLQLGLLHIGVMAGLVPAIHVLLAAHVTET